MERQADGCCTVTTLVLVPGLHYYTLIIDGAEVGDTNSRAFFGGSKYASAVENSGAGFYLLGTVEPERVRAGLLRLHASLDEAKIQHVFYESPGTDHEWQTWRPDLKDFAPSALLTTLHGKASDRLLSDPSTLLE